MTRFYSRRDLLAGALAWTVAFAGYVATLAPSVTLEYSGEFLTAAYQLGVPHPPGYPIWTIAAWLWSHLIPFGNIAWRVNLMSAFFGALACGLAALLTSKSGYVLAQKVGFLHAEANQRLVHLIVLASSVSAALMLAFSPVLWSQSVVTEVYGLNATCLLATLVVLNRWSFEPERRWRLYLAAFMWGVGLTVHQTLVLLTVAFPAFIWFTDRKLGRDVLVPILVVVIGGVMYWIFKPGSMFHLGLFAATVLSGMAIGAAVWLYFLWREGPGVMREWPAVLAVYLAVVLGLALYGYLYLSSTTNPPMNWGHCSQWDGFKHHFTRGQFEKVHTERSLLQFWGQLNMFFDDLQGQFNIVFALFALLALLFFRDLGERDRNWLKFLLIAFVFLGLGFIFLSNPTFEKQKQFTDRVFFLQCHCIYALWIGYGMMLGLGYVFTTKPQFQQAAVPVAVVVLLLPLVSVKRSWADNEQRGHDFGYRFGYLMFKPGGGYSDMERDAVLFGGTDPGRFVPTYMIFVESVAPVEAKSRFVKCPDSGAFDRRDVYIITQNALADSTYMAYIRDHYDFSRPRNDSTIQSWLGRDTIYPREPIWIPGERDSQIAFQRYIDELRTRPPLPGEEVRVEGGRVNVQGVAGVMAINSILSREIFERNKDKHAFYVEESYVIPWMFPYLEPFGIILRINKEPLAEITPAMVARDTAYWDALCQDLKSDPKFHRDDTAQKTYSKLRSAIAGLYAYRRMIREAEAAFRQAIDLCPDSPEASYRLAQLYAELGRFNEAVVVLETYQKLDVKNFKIAAAINAIHSLRRQVVETRQLEQQIQADPGNLPLWMQLAKIHAQHQRFDQLDNLVNQLVARPDLTEMEFLQLANFYAQLNRLDRVYELLALFTERHPQNPVGWYNLAVVQSVRHNCQDCIAALERAVAVGDSSGQILSSIRQDARLGNCRTNARFQQFLNEVATPTTGGAPFGISH